MTIGFRVTTSSWRQLQVVLDHEFVRTGLEDVEENEDSEGGDRVREDDDMHELQAGHWV